MADGNISISWYWSNIYLKRKRRDRAYYISYF